MSKSNKELAVELACAWLNALGNMASNPNAKEARMPQPHEVVNIVKLLTDELDKVNEK